MNCLRRAASASSFSKDLSRSPPSRNTSLSWMQGQARPGVQQAQDFAHHVECIARGAPPVPGIEGIARGGAYNGPALAGSEPAPEQADAPRMGFGRNNNHGSAFLACKSSCNDFDFVGGIHDRRREDVNWFLRNSFAHQNEGVVIVLADERNAHLFQSLARL